MTLIRVFVNNKAVEIEAGATAADAAHAAGLTIRPSDPPTITDARGIEIPADTTLGPGSILRVLTRRQDADADA